MNNTKYLMRRDCENKTITGAILIMALATTLLVNLALIATPQSNVYAGAFIFAGEGNGVDVIAHPVGYSGLGGIADVTVCVDSTAADSDGNIIAGDMEQPVRNIIAVYNKQKITTGNVRPTQLLFSELDFESTAAHELGHCLGLAHPNLGNRQTVIGNDSNYTNSTDGDPATGDFNADATFDLDAGADGIIGSADDVRGDDVNLVWFRQSNNNPFSIAPIVDATTYSRDIALLPAGDNYVANADRTLAATLLGGNAETEAVMQQQSVFGEIQRTLSHDDVATLALARAGNDETANTADDYNYNLTYGGIVDLSQPNACDITIDFDNTQTTFAVCRVNAVGSGAAGHFAITDGQIYFNNGFNWFFNTEAPCTGSVPLQQSQWQMISLPCQPGISDDGTLDTVFGDDFVGTPRIDWSVFKRNLDSGAYERVNPSDQLEEGIAYWVRTTEPNVTLDMQGELNSQPEMQLATNAVDGEFNMVGNPFQTSVNWSSVFYVESEGNQLALNDADPVIAGNRACASASPAAGCIASRLMYRWNGSAYQSFDGNVDTGTDTAINSFEGFWVEAFADNTALRVPLPVAGPEALASISSTTLSSSSSDTMGNPSNRTNKKAVVKRKKTGGWFVRVSAASKKHSDPGNTFGVVATSKNGPDAHDLKELPPFGSDYLTVVFPHEDWGEFAGDYTTDFRHPKRNHHKWTFEVRASDPSSEVTLNWDGPKTVLRNSVVIDQLTGERIKPKKGAFTFAMQGNSRTFVWKLKRARKIYAKYR